MKIYKYHVNPAFESYLIPGFSKVLSVQIQHDTPVMWVLCDPKLENVFVPVHIVGTGQEFDVTGKTFAGTFQINDGRFVFHLFTGNEE